MTLAPESSTTDHLADLGSTVDRLRSTVLDGTTRSLDWRETQLDGVIAFAKDHTDALIAAMNEDLGRPEIEGWLADVGSSITEAQHVRKNFRKWAKPRRAKIPIVAQPGSAKVIPEPLGVALIIAPWNYPVNLVLEPLVAAIAAGNAVVVKPSELAPATSGLIARELPKYLDERAFAIIEGGIETSTALLEQRFDHIFFTGSTNVGRIVMRAAAEHLTPVILELGGKSPVVVADDADLEVAANRIAWGKTLNAGQTCIAPDYVLVTEKNRDALVDKLANAWGEFYGADPEASPDFGRIINERHHERLLGLLSDQTPVVGGEHDSATKYIAPTIVVDPPLDSALMTEEIFGPILPIITVEDTFDAIGFINERPKPLALYVFSTNNDTVEAVLGRTSSGGACVNHTLLHFTPSDLPFGGVGPSGMGRYHGKSGFEALSNMKGVLRKPIFGESNIAYPPYTERKVNLLRKVT